MSRLKFWSPVCAVSGSLFIVSVFATPVPLEIASLVVAVYAGWRIARA